jgi:glycosyltransferase involved in cell wall biosynthesis
MTQFSKTAPQQRPESSSCRSLGYLSGAARVTTRPDGASSGARAHVLGCIGGFRSLGWQVSPFIYGDDVPVSIGNRAGRVMRSNLLTRTCADLARLTLRFSNARRAWSQIGHVDWVYERFASFQALGRTFQQHGIPWLLETNGPFYEEAAKERQTLALASVAKASELKAYRDCDVLLCVSNALKQIITGQGIDSDKIIVVPNGVDTQKFSPSAHQARRIFPGLTIGFVGRLNHWQGIPRLFRAMQMLRTEGKDINAVIVGDGAKRDEWMSLSEELGLHGCVHFSGQVSGDDVPAHIAGFDIGFSGQLAMKNGTMYHSPLKIYEYMAMAKPVLASAYDDARSVVRPGETGFLFESDEELVMALRRVCQSARQIAFMGEQARKEIIRNHSWEARVKTLTDQAEQILEEKYAERIAGENPGCSAGPRESRRVVA